MNVANLELCKELYELSGWGEYADVCFSYQQGMVISTKAQGAEDNDGFLRPWATPAYDLGYLLRKLPHFVHVGQLSGGYTPFGWYAEKITSQDYTHTDKFFLTAQTPEDAAAKLAIELFKQGILQEGKS